ncbi:MAG: hypothetical protein ACYSUQ_14110 [Planctomycetota bacterium]|jgi:hypothetical protein
MRLVLVATGLAGCATGAGVDGGDGNGTSTDEGSGSGGDRAVGDDEVSIRFVNTSDLDVDTQFYAANEALENPREDLFQPRFRIQESIGVAGTGIVQAGTQDEITFPCSANTFLGTAGGEFRDPDRGTLLATGQLRFSRVGDSFDCGNTVVFGFANDGDDYDSVPPIPDSRD